MAHAIVVTATERPKLAKAIGLSLIAVIALASMSQAAHATPVLLDPIAQEFSSATEGWMQNSYALGTAIFLSVSAVTLTYNLIAFYVAHESMTGMSAVIVRSLLRFAMPFAILQAAPSLLYNIVGTAGQFLAKITGGNIATPAETATANSVSPDSIVHVGIQIAWQLPTTAFSVVQKVGFQPVDLYHIQQLPNSFSGNMHQAIVDIILCLAALISGIFVAATFWLIAAELLIAYIEISFCSAIGCMVTRLHGLSGDILDC